MIGAARRADPEGFMRFIGEGVPLGRQRDALGRPSRACSATGPCALAASSRSRAKRRAACFWAGWDPLSSRILGPAPSLTWSARPRALGVGLCQRGSDSQCRDWAFGTLKLPRLVSVIIPENRASIRVAERKIGERFQTETTEIDGIPVRIYAISNPRGLERQERSRNTAPGQGSKGSSPRRGSRACNPRCAP